MNESLGWRQWVDSAARLLEEALANDDVGIARQAFQRVALAEASLICGSLVDAPEAEKEREQLRRLASTNPELMARAAANVTRPLLLHGREGLRDSLLARSGYQILLDLGAWTEPPLSDFHLADVDEALADATEAEPLRLDEVPAGLPKTHIWWSQRIE